MIQPQTLVKIADNSGAKIGRVFKVLGGSRKRYARIGDKVVLSVQTAEPKKLAQSAKKKDVFHAVIVRQVAPYRRKDGSYIRFDENAAVLIEKGKYEPRGNRIFGPVPRELSSLGYQKIVSLANEVI
ncbi:MAG: 50S ribosomal protein L14 [Candidatus Campbellbacteria bacterium]|nr:50S ribosomal protein L14 [Candidatus Campbellbacteria bacterium]